MSAELSLWRHELIKIESREISGATVQTCNARDLHSFLDVGKVFAAWIPERIEQYGFIENQDFVVFSDFGNNPKGGRPAKEYAITIDMAKELAMVERNEKGKQARQYFIECELRAKSAPIVDPMQALNDPATMRGLLLGYSEKVLTLESKVGELEPKAEALDRIATANGSFCIRDAAKTLQVQEKWLRQFMREHEWIYQRPMGHGWLAYADRLKQGLMEHKTTTGEKSDGSEWVDTQARITAKGMAKLSTLIQEHGQPRLAA